MSTQKLALVWLLNALVSTSANADTPNLTLGEPLANALSAYRSLGLNIVSSTGLMAKRKRVTLFPEPDLDIVSQVQQLLTPHDLVLKHLQDDTWYVARAEHSAEAEPPSKPTEPYHPVVEEIVVSASYRLSRFNQLQNHLDRRDLQTIPSAGGDTLRAIATLPGSATSGVAASHRFRGGDQNEVLYLLDGVPMIEPFHLRDFYNVFTAVNPNVVTGAEIFTSGFPVQYGGKISGVVSLDLLQPTDRFEGALDLNMIAVAAHAGGSTVNANWLVSARRSTIDALLSRLEADYGRPRFHDELVRAEWSGSNKVVSFGLINTDDEVQLNDADTGERGSSRFGYRTAWGNGSIAIGSRWFSELQLFWLRAEGRHSGTVENPTDAVGRLSSATSYDVVRLHNKWIWSPPSKHELEFGWLIERQTGDFGFELNTIYGSLGAGLQSETRLDRSFEVDRSGTSLAAHASLTSELSKSVTLRSGLRYDLQDIDPIHDVQLSPRFQLAWVPSDHWQVLLDAGRYVQHQNLFEIQIDDGLVELQPPQSSQQLSLSIAHMWTSGLKLRADTYYRYIDDPWTRFDNLYNPWVLLPELHADRYQIIPTRAILSGLELTFSRKHLNGWSWYISYTLSDARERVAGRWHSRPWDQRHTFKTGVLFEGERWDASFLLTHRTGWPTTKRLDASSEIEMNLNERQLPSFVSFDLHLARKLSFARLEGEIYLDISNVLDRVNVGGYQYQLQNTGWLREAQRLLPLFPTLGFRVSW